MHMSMQVSATAEITPERRDEITKLMSQEMGKYISGIDKMDFMTWTEQEWNDFVQVAFENAAIHVFMERIKITKPCVEVDSEDRL